MVETVNNNKSKHAFIEFDDQITVKYAIDVMNGVELYKQVKYTNFKFIIVTQEIIRLGDYHNKVFIEI